MHDQNNHSGVLFLPLLVLLGSCRGSLRRALYPLSFSRSSVFSLHHYYNNHYTRGEAHYGGESTGHRPGMVQLK